MIFLERQSSTVETRYNEIWYNKISDITNYFLWSQWINLLCFVLLFDYWCNKISDITNKISWSQGSRYTEFPLYMYMDMTRTWHMYVYEWIWSVKPVGAKTYMYTCTKLYMYVVNYAFSRSLWCIDISSRSTSRQFFIFLLNNLTNLLILFIIVQTQRDTHTQLLQNTKQWNSFLLTLNVPEKLQLYGLHVYYVVHICDFGMLRVNRSCHLGSCKCWMYKA